MPSSAIPFSFRSSWSIRISLLMVLPSRSFSTSLTASSSSKPSAIYSLILSQITFRLEYHVRPRGSGRQREPHVASSSSMAGWPSIPSRYSFQTSSTVPTVPYLYWGGPADCGVCADGLGRTAWEEVEGEAGGGLAGRLGVCIEIGGPRGYEAPADGCWGGGGMMGRIEGSRELRADAAAWCEATRLPRRSFNCWLILSNCAEMWATYC